MRTLTRSRPIPHAILDEELSDQEEVITGGKGRRKKNIVTDRLVKNARKLATNVFNKKGKDVVPVKSDTQERTSVATSASTITISTDLKRPSVNSHLRVQNSQSLYERRRGPGRPPGSKNKNPSQKRDKIRAGVKQKQNLTKNVQASIKEPPFAPVEGPASTKPTSPEVSKSSVTVSKTETRSEAKPEPKSDQKVVNKRESSQSRKEHVSKDEEPPRKRTRSASADIRDPPPPPPPQSQPTTAYSVRTRTRTEPARTVSSLLKETNTRPKPTTVEKPPTKKTSYTTVSSPQPPPQASQPTPGQQSAASQPPRTPPTTRLRSPLRSIVTSASPDSTSTNSPKGASHTPVKPAKPASAVSTPEKTPNKELSKFLFTFYFIEFIL
jgi:hypothetical protein